MPQVIIIKSNLDIANPYFKGEVLEEKPSYWKLKVTHNSFFLPTLNMKPYNDYQYPDGIRIFYKAFNVKLN